MKISLTKTQYSALMDIYGPPANVHKMIMSATLKEGKHFIEGEDDDFDELLSLINEEIVEGLCSRKNASALLGICKKVDPDAMDWIGQ